MNVLRIRKGVVALGVCLALVTMTGAMGQPGHRPPHAMMNRPGTPVRNQEIHQRNFNGWNDNRREASILVLPPELCRQREVVLQQHVVLRGDFTEWRGEFGGHGIVLRRRAAEFSGYIVDRVGRQDASMSQFFGFTNFMMVDGQIRYGKRYTYRQGPFEVVVQLAEIESYGTNLASMSFNLLVLEDKSQTPTPPEFDVTSLVWEGRMTQIETPVGEFQLSADDDRRTMRLEKCPPGGTWHDLAPVETFSRESLEDAIRTGRQIEHTEKGFTLMVRFTEAEYDPDDGAVKSVHAEISKSRN